MTSAQRIELKNVHKSYAIGKNRITIFDDLTLTVPRGDFLSIMGPSGSGKSTILNLIGGIDRADKGEIVIDDIRLNQMSDAALTSWRAANVGFVFQFYNLLPMLTAAQNVELPLLLTPLRASERKARVDTILDIVGLAERRHHLPSELSGGQQQRIGIARAIAMDPKILLCDEPTGDLDRDSANEILHILQLLNSELGKTIIMVTHDDAAARVAKSSVILDKGKFRVREVAA